ncbi:MAG: malate synthase A [Bacteroidetes bacterium]|nr:malate synthase A [Bacteroidota bacterium]
MSPVTATLLKGIEINAPVLDAHMSILTTDALEFIAHLHRRFNVRRKQLLAKRFERQQEIDKGIFPSFLPETKHIRESEWTVAPLSKDLLDRRVEITGPVDRKMIINALNSGANVFMADFEDSTSPTWNNIIEGQINLRDAVSGTITYYNNANGKTYRLNEKTAVLFVRPRGWHMEEKHFLVDDEFISASIFDFGLYFYHNVHELLKKGTAPYFYLPKIESHLEARLWNEIFTEAQKLLNIPLGTIKATVLIETILASFEMDEILFELRQHSAGLNCGRWDYIFSFIKKFRAHSDFVLPERSQVTMTTHFLRSYSQLLIQTCHKRNVHAMGGMAAQIPIKNDEETNLIALEKVCTDKEREAKDGHDGTWVAHPALVPIAKEIFNKHMPSQNQIHVKREDVKVSAKDLVQIPEGTITEEGIITNIDVAIQYIASWLRGTGCVPIYNLMEDAATAEISRTQIWQWLHNKNVKLSDGRIFSFDIYETIVPKAIAKIKNLVGEKSFRDEKYEEAFMLFNRMVNANHLHDFLTTLAYQQLD